MNTPVVRKLLLVAALVIAVLAAFGLSGKPAPARGDVVLELQAPAGESSIASVIGDEAGVAAYFNAATAINLADVRDIYRTIENDPLVGDPNYILGSVAVTGYSDSEDVHVYVHKDGWFMAYYLKSDPAAKLIDWWQYHDSGRTIFITKLDSALTRVAAEASLSFPGATYYDFRYPNANRLTLVGEWVNAKSTDSFQVTLPGSFVYYERSWSFGANVIAYNQSAWYDLDGIRIISLAGYRVFPTAEGTLTASQLLPDQSHSIAIGGSYYDSDYVYGGLALVYRIP